MTAENNGSGSAPEGDDPFAYLYRQEGAAGSPGQASQAGVPRRSYNQVRAVGERQYGQPTQAGQQAGYGQQPNAHYAAPETMPGGRAAARKEAQGRGGEPGGGRNRTGLLVGAIAVVAAVVIGIGAAVFFNSDDEATGDEQAGNSQPTAPAKESQDSSGGGDEKAPAELPKADAATLRLDGGAAPAKDVADAKANGGTYVAGMNKPGAAVTWELKDIPKGGKYTLFVGYGVPGEDADASLAVNGKPSSQKLNLSNFSGAEKGDWEKGWTRTFSWVNLEEGENTVSISCGDGNNCNFNLDQLWLKQGWVKS